jgi:twinkle protein
MSSGIRIRPGEMSVWAGINGHGKSTMLVQVLLWLADQGSRGLVASFEMEPERSIQKMFHMFVGGPFEDEAQLDRFNDYCKDKLWIYTQTGTVASSRVLELMHYGVQELGIQQFVIDSLMKCGLGVDDYSAQKMFVDELSTFAKDNGVHVHLVAHSRKRDNENSPISKFDIKGAGEITDMADNVFTLFRNKTEDRQAPDAILICDKQRHGDWEGRLNLNFNAGAKLFIPPTQSHPISLPSQAEPDLEWGSR